MKGNIAINGTGLGSSVASPPRPDSDTENLNTDSEIGSDTTTGDAELLIFLKSFKGCLR